MREPLVIVEMFKAEDNPNAVGFMFESEDGGPLSAQKILDALSEWLLFSDPNMFSTQSRKYDA